MSSPSDSPVASSSSELRPPRAAGDRSCKGHARGSSGPWRRLVGLLRGLVRYVVRTPERLLHGRRRRRALARLGERPRPRSILFVCVGNICRSPYAERRFRQRLAPGVAETITVRSAGFGEWDRPSPREAVAEAERRGVDLTPHRSRALTHEVVDDTDLFVVTTTRQELRLRREQGIDPDRILHLGDLDPEPIRARRIEDPWGKERKVFRKSYDRIDRCLDVLADALETASPAPPR